MKKTPLTPSTRIVLSLIVLLLVSLMVGAFTPLGRRVTAGILPLGAGARLKTKAIEPSFSTLHVSTEQELRDALTATTGAQNGDTVVFDANITLSRDLPAVQNSITINGNGHFLDGAGAHRGLFVYAGTVLIQNLAIQNAVAQGGASDGGGGGGAGLGGALFVNTGANVTLSAVSLNGNAAKGGNGATGFYAGGGGLGGDGRQGGGGVGMEADGGTTAGSAPGTGIVTGAASGGGADVGQSGSADGGGGAASTNNGGNGGGGVGGGSAVGGLNGGAGGFGGGGGGGGLLGNGGAGGFGGGGGSGILGSIGGFGGGGGGNADGNGADGGFGAGAGGANAAAYAELSACNARCAPPVPGGGVSVNVSLGGGGLGAGGAVFVRDGGTLLISGVLTETGSTVTAGQSYQPPGAGGPPNPCDCLAVAYRKVGSLGANGSAFGSGLFLQGNGTLSFAPGQGESQSIADVIADQTGSGGTGANSGSWSLSKSGAGTLSLNAANTYTGGTTINAGTLSLGNATSAGTGAITFTPGQTATLQVNASSVPTNTIKGFAPGHTIDLAGAGLATNASLDANNVLTITGGTISPIILNLDPAQNFSAYAFYEFKLASDNNGGTAVTLVAFNTISGQVKLNNAGLSGVMMTLSGSSSLAIPTNGLGNYSFPNLTVGGNYTVTPSLAGYSFTPTSKTFNNLSANQTQDFIASVSNTCGTLPSSITYSDGTHSVAFTNLTGCGDTTITPISGASAGTLPFGYALQGLDLAWDVTTTAAYSGSIVVTFKVPSSIDAETFAKLRVLHGENGVLVDRTILAPDTPAPNFASREISARVSSLSPFVIAVQNSLPLAASDQKAGSVLVFPYYTSDQSANFAKSDTLITITNVSNANATLPSGAPNYQYLHLFFMKDCSPADTFVCLTPNGSIQILASNYDPLTTGYLIAVAVDVNGVPMQNNSFIGSAFVRDDVNGIIDSYSAEAFAKLTSTSAPITNGNALIALDGINYEAAASQLNVQLQDPAKSEQTIVLASLSGDLGTALKATGQDGVGALFRDDEAPASFQPSLGNACFIVRPVTNQSIRIVPGSLSSFLKDRFGYLKFNLSSPAVGLMLSRQGSAANYPKNRYAGIHGLHKTATAASILTLPVMPPFCQ